MPWATFVEIDEVPPFTTGGLKEAPVGYRLDIASKFLESVRSLRTMLSVFARPRFSVTACVSTICAISIR